MRFPHSLMASLLFLLGLPVMAQHRNSVAPVPDTYGTASRTYLALSAWNFIPADSSATYGYALYPWGIYRTNTTGSARFHAGLQLPAGAVVDYFELNVCDTTPTAGVDGWILSGARDGTFGTVANFSFATTPLETPGCVVRSMMLPTPFTVDNNAHVYNVEVWLNEAGPGLALIGAHVGYKLQVSPPPVIATFGDVSNSHPFYQYIEALAASGVTAGCGGGNYCPDAALTRGQMAVFLAKALGLHWAP